MRRVALPSSAVSVMQLPRHAGAAGEEDVVMIHGLAANLGFWYAGAAQWFTRFAQVTLYDLRGHGNSDMPASGYSPGHLAEDLAHLLDNLRLERVHLVAHSFGGMVALSFALRHPERVKSLVLADVRLWQAEPPSWKNVPPAWIQRMRGLGLGLEDERMDPSFQVLTELARMKLTRPEAARAAFAAMPGGQALFQGRRAARRWLDLISSTDAYGEMTSGLDFALSDLTRLHLPILAAFGEHSLRHRSAKALQRLCPACRIEIVPNAGHFFPLTRPRVFAAAAIQFLAEAAAQDSGGKPAAADRSPGFEDVATIDGMCVNA